MTDKVPRRGPREKPVPPDQEALIARILSDIEGARKVFAVVGPVRLAERRWKNGVLERLQNKADETTRPSNPVFEAEPFGSPAVRVHYYVYERSTWGDEVLPSLAIKEPDLDELMDMAIPADIEGLTSLCENWKKHIKHMWSIERARTTDPRLALRATVCALQHFERMDQASAFGPGALARALDRSTEGRPSDWELDLIFEKISQYGLEEWETVLINRVVDLRFPKTTGADMFKRKDQIARERDRLRKGLRYRREGKPRGGNDLK